VYRVAHSVLPLLWKQAAPFIALALRRAHGRYTIDNVKDWVLNGTHQLWVVTENGRAIAALLTEVSRLPSGKRMFEIVLTGGSRVREWMPQAAGLVLEYAHLCGATEIRVVGRRGWLRHLKPYGFEQEAVVLTREEV
jgi:hypothetical protein